MILIYLAALASAGQADSPRAFVQRIYAGYRNENYDPLGKPDRIFAGPLTAAIKEDARLAHGEVGYLDGDPLCACQDTGGMHSAITSVTGTASAAIAHVLVTWDGTRDQRDIQLKLVKTPAGWRIADVGSQDDKSLLHSLQAANRQARKH